MKFLCVPCNSPMTLQSVSAPQGGSLAIVFSCPLCGYEMSMLTNPYETQLVQSLGMPLGPADLPAGASAQAGASAKAGPKCPFPAMVPETEGALQGAAQRPATGIEAAAPLRWTAGAEARFANIPEFVRPMARTGIERFARERGASEVDEAILDAARDFFGM